MFLIIYFIFLYLKLERCHYHFLIYIFILHRYDDEVIKCDANIYYAENYLQSCKNEG